MYSKLILSLSVLTILTACGGGDSLTDEEITAHDELMQKYQEHKNPEVSAIPEPVAGRKGTMPVNCAVNPSQCS